MMERKLYFLGIAMALLLGLTGCGSGESQPGVVARINGEPIYLSQLKSEYDLLYMDWSSTNNLDVDSLRLEYGTALGNMILQILIRQTLSREGLSVTDADVAKAEAEIRADYPPEVFEQTLLEEYIDIDQWRAWLRERLSMEKFLREYLRPKITIGYEAARTYYRDHISDFLIPESFAFTLFEGKEGKKLVAASSAYRENGPAGLAERFPEVQIHELEIPRNALSPAWLSTLEHLAPGHASKVLTGRSGMTLLYLKQRDPETILSPLKAYPVIEKILMEQELKKVFAAWMQDASGSAVIEVTPLLKQVESEKNAVSPCGNENATC